VKTSIANDNQSDGFNVHGGTNIIFEGCTAAHNGDFSQPNVQGADGDGFTFHGTATGTIRYSLAKNNKKSAVAHVGSAEVDMYYNIFTHDTKGQIALVYLSDAGTYNLYNNVLYSAGQTGVGMSIANDVNATIKNTIIQGFYIGMKATTSGNLEEDYNMFYNSTTDYQGFTLGNHSLTGINPQFVNTANYNFSLQETSPAIDVGVNVNLMRDFSGTIVPQGGKSDIGSFEYVPQIAT
jgi:hypothetical protein